MKNIVLFFVTVFCLNGCVKDPKEISPNQLFKVNVDNKNFEESIIIADKTIIYKIEIETLEGINIDDGKQITVSVSEGNLSSVSNLSSNPTSTQINVIIQGGKAIFFYSAGRKAVKSAILSLSLESISQVVKFEILPSEPISMQLSSMPVYPAKSENIEITAYLFKNNNNDQFCSDNLKIDFTTFKYSESDSIQPSLVGPTFSYSKFDEQLNMVSAKKTITTNKVPGKIIAVAKYLKTDGALVTDTILVRFSP